MNAIIVLKFADISLRLHFCKKIDEGADMGELIPYNLEYNTTLRYLNVLIYPITFYLSLL